MRILLAEDEEALSRAIVAILKKNQYEADAVFNGQDALDALVNGGYDAAVMDIMMPGMDGMEALKRARAAGVRIPILMLTAKSEITDIVSGLDGGADDYMTKPFYVRELLARIRAMTRPNTQTDGKKLKTGNITLDLGSFELSTQYGKYRLTRKEFQLMQIFMSNPNQMITADTIMDKVWGYDSEVDGGIVRVYISYLRKKLISLKADQRIQASRNIGYVMEAGGCSED